MPAVAFRERALCVVFSTPRRQLAGEVAHFRGLLLIQGLDSTCTFWRLQALFPLSNGFRSMFSALVSNADAYNANYGLTSWQTALSLVSIAFAPMSTRSLVKYSINSQTISTSASLLSSNPKSIIQV